MRRRTIEVLCFSLLTACPGTDNSSQDATDGEASSSGTEVTTSTTTADDGTPSSTASADSTDDGMPSTATAGSSGDDSGDATTSGPSGTSTGEPTCSVSSICAATVPDWVGPVAISRGDVGGMPLTCGGTYSQSVYQGLAELSEAAHECECACEANGADEVSCAPAEVGVHDNAVCFSIPSVEADVGSGCVDVPNFSTSNWVFVDEPDILGEGCDEDTTGTTIGDVDFTERVIACQSDARPEDNLDCEDDELCVTRPAIPFDSTVCVLQEGEHDCPRDTDYSERTLYYTNFDDTRACPNCACTLSGAGCDVNNMTFHSSNNCTGNPVGSASSEGCSDAGPVNGFIISSILGGGADAEPGSCTANAGTSDEQGGVEPSEPTTVCCRPD